MSGLPWMYVVAGPNGAGKSTLVGMLLADVPVVNPDDIARGIDPETPERAAFTAGRHALREVAGHLRAGRTFAVETTLAGKWIFGAMERARRRGFRIMLIYVGVAPEVLAVQRVAERVQAGGHDVPAEAVRRRYRTSLTRLSDALAVADQAVLYDNSAAAGAGPRVFAELEDGVVTALEVDLPSWFDAALGGVTVGTSLRERPRPTNRPGPPPR